MTSFNEYHETNPQVYARLKKLAFAQKKTGVRRLSISGLFDALRTERVSARKPSNFSISNAYKPDYLRLLMKQNPGLDGMFITRD